MSENQILTISVFRCYSGVLYSNQTRFSTELALTVFNISKKFYLKLSRLGKIILSVIFFSSVFRQLGHSYFRHCLKSELSSDRTKGTCLNFEQVLNSEVHSIVKFQSLTRWNTRNFYFSNYLKKLFSSFSKYNTCPKSERSVWKIEQNLVRISDIWAVRFEISH